METCSFTAKEKDSALRILLEKGTHSALENIKIQQQTTYILVHTYQFHKDSCPGCCKYEKKENKGEIKEKSMGRFYMTCLRVFPIYQYISFKAVSHYLMSEA